VGRVRNSRVQWVRETGADAARGLAAELAGRVEFVFIDGDHRYDGLRSDWEEWSGLIAPGGSVALHDSRSSPARRIDNAGSVRFAREVILVDPRYEVADTIDSLSVLRRRPSRHKSSSPTPPKTYTTPGIVDLRWTPRPIHLGVK
jgi:predicted O-methyltransferase YrrM